MVRVLDMVVNVMCMKASMIARPIVGIFDACSSNSLNAYVQQHKSGLHGVLKYGQRVAPLRKGTRSLECAGTYLGFI